MSAAKQPASAGSVVASIAQLTWIRLVRGRALWVSVVIALLPVLFAAILGAKASRRDVEASAGDLFVFAQLVLAVLPPMFIASSIGEEIEDRTTTYLWSRALPRWTIVVGKLAALVPIVLVLILGSWTLATGLLGGGHPAMSYVALGVSTICISALSAALATLVPKHAMALGVCYLLFFDLPIGALPASLKEISITHHARSLAHLQWSADDPYAITLLAVGILTTIWMTLALWRIRRIES